MNDCVILDIDGVLADYRIGLLWWINVHYPILRSVCYEHLKRTDTWLSSETMGVTLREWLDILEKFRMSGGKLTIPAFSRAADLTQLVHEDKKKIILITSRPIDIYSNIYRDTLEWLKANRIVYDLLLWSKYKSDIIYKLRLIDGCCFAVDDELNHVRDYVSLGIKTFWLDHYDKSTNLKSPNLIRVNNLEEIINQLGVYA